MFHFDRNEDLCKQNFFSSRIDVSFRFSCKEPLIDLRKNHPNNPLVGYLNINFLGNKIAELTQVCKKVPIYILYIDKTKLDLSFSEA